MYRPWQRSLRKKTFGCGMMPLGSSAPLLSSSQCRQVLALRIFNRIFFAVKRALFYFNANNISPLGFGMLESGCVSLKNEVNIMMKNVVDVVLGGVTYWASGTVWATARITGRTLFSRSEVGSSMLMERNGSGLHHFSVSIIFCDDRHHHRVRRNRWKMQLLRLLHVFSGQYRGLLHPCWMDLGRSWFPQKPRCRRHCWIRRGTFDRWIFGFRGRQDYGCQAWTLGYWRRSSHGISRKRRDRPFHALVGLAGI